MTTDRQRNAWATLLIALGLFFLLANTGWLAGLASWFWGLLFLAGGGAFLVVYRNDRRHWWALIPGFSLVAVGVAALSGDTAGALFLALLGTGFAAVYLSDRQRWWAIIPAGVLYTLALVAWTSTVWPRADAGWLFFLGIAATFGLLFVLPEGEGRQRWAIYPALGSLVFVAITLMASNVGGVLVPLLLIGAGAYLVWRQGSSRGPSASKGA